MSLFDRSEFLEIQKCQNLKSSWARSNGCNNYARSSTVRTVATFLVSTTCRNQKTLGTVDHGKGGGRHQGASFVETIHPLDKLCFMSNNLTFLLTVVGFKAHFASKAYEGKAMAQKYASHC